MNKKKFLIISSNEEKCERFRKWIGALCEHSQVYTAADGVIGQNKIVNDPPQIIIADLVVPKTIGTKAIDYVLQDPKLKEVAIIIADQPTKKEMYCDELVTGRVQFLLQCDDPAEFEKILFKSLKFTTADDGKAFSLKYLSNGEILMREGEKADFVYILKQGKLLAFQERNGKKIELGFVSPSEFVGEMAYINGEPRSATVEAVTQCELIAIPLGTFEAILYRRPAWAKTLMAILSKRLKNLNQSKT